MSIFGQGMNLRQALIIGGIPINKQEEQLENYPHIVVGTPGRIRYLLEKNENFRENLARTEMVVLDEADRMLDMGFEPQIRKIIEQIRVWV